MIARPLALWTTLLLVGTAAADPPAAPLKLAQTIALPDVRGRIDHLAIDADGKRLYVAALGNDTVEVIDLAAGKRTDRIRGLSRPTGMRVLPGSGNVLVASGGDGKVRVFAPDLKLLGTIDGLDDADNVRLDADGRLAYVGYGDGAIAVIDPVAIRKVADVKLDGHPEAFQLEAKGNRLFVNVPSAKHVAVIDRDKRTVIATWPIREAEAHFPMALDEPNHRLFVVCRAPAKVLVLDTETGKVVASAACCEDADDVFFDPASKRLLVSGGGAAVTVIQQEDADHYRAVADVATAPGARTSLFAPETGKLYVAAPARVAREAELRIYDVLR